MVLINIIFYTLISFFGTSNGHIFAKKTTVTIFPESKKIEIIQDDLFSFIKTEKDSLLALNEWNILKTYEAHKKGLSKDLKRFKIVDFTLFNSIDEIQPKLSLHYKNENDLSKMGIWFNTEKKQYSINHIPEYHIKTTSGQLSDNYWLFNGNKTFSFTLEPIIQKDNNELQIYSLEKIISNNK